jgi:hypothetical protein
MPPRWLRPFSSPAIGFEVRATETGIEQFLVVPESLEPVVVFHVRASLPGPASPAVTQEKVVRPTLASELALSTSARPLRVDMPQGVSAAILASLHPLRPAASTEPPNARRVLGVVSLIGRTYRSAVRSANRPLKRTSLPVTASGRCQSGNSCGAKRVGSFPAR